MNSMSLPTGANADVIETAYRAWLDNPDSVDPTWRAFFQGFTLGSNGNTPLTAAGVSEPARKLSKAHDHHIGGSK